MRSRKLTLAIGVAVLVSALAYTWTALPTRAERDPSPDLVARDGALSAVASSEAVRGESASSGKIVRALPKPKPEAAPAAERTAPEPAAAPAPPRSMLRAGMRGDDVAALQRQLTALHYDQGRVDGVFGNDTAHAVVAFQKLHGLKRTGVVDAATRAKLSDPVVPRPRQPRSGFYLEADLTKQVLVAFRGTKVDRILDTSSAQQGIVVLDGQQYRSRTPTGSFAVQRMLDGWRQSRWGQLYRPAYFHEGFAIHGVRDGPKPYPASLGCLNVTMAAMDRLRVVIVEGTPVRIYAS
jgi:Putative peptidoglycan binding domain/L,D-transpeptidase catalytic domain